jgi:hypothetical protein
MSAFSEVAVRFASLAGAFELAGTFTAPSCHTSPPAVVLVSGTGPVDRDVTFVGHALFRVLAHSLARAGIASLRFDKRGVGESQGAFSAAGPDDFVADVSGAVNYLVREKGFPAQRVGLLGHSEGGMVALTAAARMGTTPFCVLLASPMLSGTDNLVRSFALLARGSFERDGVFDRYAAELTTLIGAARYGDTSVPRADAVALAASLAPRIVNARTQVILGGSTLSGMDFLDLLASPCLETCLSWDPSRVVPLVKCPILLIYAAKDVQAPAVENIAAARALIERLGRDDWTVEQVAGMNHAFQRCATGMPDEYARIDHVMADEVVREVATWIHSIVRR